MATANLFDDYRTDVSKLHVSYYRRTGAAFRDARKRIFGRSRKAGVASVASGGFEAATTLVIPTMAAVGEFCAGGAVCAALAGPWGAIGAGLVGLGAFAYSQKTDRETAHRKLQPYVWSLIDDQKPESIPEGKEKEVFNAALTLLSDGHSQIHGIHSKFESNKQMVTPFFNEVSKVQQDNSRFLHEIWNGMARIWDMRGSAAAPTLNQINQVAVKMRSGNQKVAQQWRAGQGSGGVIFNYMRRLVHVGNYLQSGQVVSHMLQTKMANSSSPTPALLEVDPLTNYPLAATSREVLNEVSSALIHIEMYACILQDWGDRLHDRLGDSKLQRTVRFDDSKDLEVTSGSHAAFLAPLKTKFGVNWFEESTDPTG